MKITKKILSEEQIQERIIKLASEINTDYEGKNLIILGVLKGAFIAISDLAKNLNIDVSFEFMSISSYEGSESTGQIKIEKDLDKILSVIPNIPHNDVPSGKDENDNVEGLVLNVAAACCMCVRRLFYLYLQPLYWNIVIGD